MEKIKTILAVMLMSVALSACANVPQLKNSADIVPFPQATKGYTRYVIRLPELTNENNARVELLIGKTMSVDCNIQRLIGTVKQEELKGWGYPYYVVENIKGGISTMMACPNVEKRNEFVTMNNNIEWLRYNSRLPIVVYAPSDLQVKYRIWTLGENTLPAGVE